MYLKQLSLHNFKCFEQLDLQFDSKLTVLVGANGSGKTTILEGAAIAVSAWFMAFDGLKSLPISKKHAHLMTYSIGSTSDVQPQFPVTVGASAIIDGQEVTWERSLNTMKGQTTIRDASQYIDIAADYQKRLRAGDTTLCLPLLAYYGTGRLWDYHREKQSDIFGTNTRTNGYIDCLDGTANIKLMMNWFAKMTVQKYQNQENGMGPVPELNTVYAAMEQCYKAITGLTDVKIQYNVSTKDLGITYPDENGLPMRIPINQLSDGYKSTISLVADIAYRMAVLNPQLLDRILTETSGIVLIDEVDLHLHPAWQKQILHDLTNIFPKVQFVVTTHAPEVINSAERENVLVITGRQALPAPAETYGKDANGILKTIMNVEERPKEICQKFEDFYQALEAQNYKAAETILTELEDLLGTDPELSAMRVQLDLEQL